MKFIAFITIFTLLIIQVDAQQRMTFNHPSAKAFAIQKQDGNSLSISFALPQLVFDTLKTDEETFLTLTAEGFAKCYKTGEPDLPVYNQLIVVPSNVNLSLSVMGSSEELIQLNSVQAGIFIKPAQASIPKRQNNPDKIPFVKGIAYKTYSFTKTPVVELREVGIMRNVKIYELVYQPVLYNAITSEIKIRHQSSIELQWDETFTGSSTWNFTNLDVRNLNQQTTKNAELRETYVIVSPSTYKETLQPFVHWKKLQGFVVIEAYIGEAIESANKNVIKTYLKSLYNTPTDGVTAPSYLLIVGDVAEIPAWSGIAITSETYVTDLYYAEYTNDFLPEVYFGRFSVNNTQQLQAIIDKTLYIEKGAGNQRGYQNEHLLISGVDSDYAPIYGNGALNYFLDYYSTPEIGVNSHYYFYGSGSPIVSNSPAAKQAILNNFDAGVGIAYYTAHCSPNGWTSPAFTTNDIGTVNNTNKYPLMIGNCCQSYSFNLNSFGEEIVRAPEKGAVAYIGATFDSYWDEDYYWGVGFTSNIVLNPTYESTGLGSWDAWFHTHNETVYQKAFSAGQIVNAGNLAVQSSNSDLKGYYWEIYGIMGDPSLVPAKYQLITIVPQYNEVLTVGQSTLTIHATQGAKVTLSENGEIVAFGKTDANNTTNLTFKPLLHVGDKVVEICVSHPDFAPSIDTLMVIGPENPYLVITDVIINDSIDGNNNHLIEYGENIDYYFEIKNFGTQNGQNISVTINSSNEWIKPLSNNTMVIPNINAGETLVTSIPFQVEFKNDIPDQELVLFTGIFNYNDSLATDINFTATVNAPNIQETNWLIDMAGIGNGNGIVEENEDVTLTVFFTNQGHAQVSGTVVTFTSSNNDLLTVNSDSFGLGGMNPSEAKSIDVLAKGGASFFPGAQVFMNVEILAGDSSQYHFTETIPLILGSTPNILMHNGTEEVITENFYDTGGPNGKYFNSESNSLTLIPHNAGEGIMVSFDEFDVESSNYGTCWDKLSVYDGTNTTAPLLGAFCNANFINFFQSQNSAGALTFVFESDESIAKNGWKAFVSSSPKSSVTFNLTDGIEQIPGVEVEFVNTALVTNESGKAIFNNTLNWSTKKYTLAKTGYFTKTGTIEDLLGDTVISILLIRLPEVCFVASENAQPLADVMITFNNDTLYTDTDGKAAFISVLPGTKDFKASKTGYIDTIGTIVVSTNNYNYTLEMRHITAYSASFVISDRYDFVSDAAVTVDGVTKLTSTEGIAQFDGLQEGLYGYIIEKSGYSNYEGTFTIIDSSVDLVVEMYLVGIGDGQKKGLKIYPNPVSKGKSLLVQSNTLVDKLVIYNYTGTTLVTINEPDTEYTLDFSGFSSGIYILQAKVTDEWIYEKVIVE